MPAYVITPNGQVHSYPGAHYAVRGERATELYESREKKQWIAEELRRDIRSAPGSTLASIKLALRKLDARTRYWKD